MNRFLVSLLFISLIGACNSKSDKETTSITILDSPANSPAEEPYLFSDEAGAIYLSWIERKDNQNELKFSKLSGDKWTEPVTITSGNNWFVNWADYPMMAVNSEEMIAHYLEKSGDGPYAYDIKLTLSKDGGQTWTEPHVLHDDGKQAEHGFVSLLPYEENFFVAWLDGRNTVMEGGGGHHEGHHGEMSVRAAVLDKTGNKLDEWQLDNRTCECCQTSAAITSNGPIVVYRDRSDGEVRDMSIVRFVNGEWTKPERIYEDNWKIAGCPVNGPRTVAKGNTVAVAWFSSPDNTPQVKVIFSTDGGATFNDPVQVDEGNAIGRVDIVMIDDNNVMVTWMEGSTIKAARINRNGTKEPALEIASSSKARSSGFPQLAKSGNRLLFAWTDSDSKSIKVAALPL